MGELWWDDSWNCIRGCRRKSAGCENCYAEAMAHRFSGPGGPYEGLTILGKKGPRWSGKAMLVPKHLGDPLRWTRPRKVFVNSMSDVFFEPLPFEYVAAMFGVMAFTPRHTHQALTKRPARGREFFGWLEDEAQRHPEGRTGVLLDAAREALPIDDANARRKLDKAAAEMGEVPWPLPNVWLGVSAEDQETADLRVPHLLSMPAAVRWVSYEPALGPINFNRPRWLRPIEPTWGHRSDGLWGCDTCCNGDRCDTPRHADRRHCVVCKGIGAIPFDGLDWIVIGGESRQSRPARPFDLQWCRDTIAACKAAGVAVFAKQKGANANDRGVAVVFRDSKGSDMSEWPEEMRVQEYPGQAA